MAQVLMVVMISHMFLDLRAGDPQAQESTESNGVAPSSFLHWKKLYQAPLSLDTWFIGPEKISNVVGTLGNDLVHTSL